MHFNGRFVMNLAQFAAQQGANMKELIALSGLSESQLCKDDCQVGPEIYDNVIAGAISSTGDELFGLHAGENLNMAAAGLIAQIAQTSETVKQAIEYCCEFANLGCSALPTTLEKDGDNYKVTLIPDPVWLKQSPQSVKHTVDGFIAFTIREFQTLTRNKHSPIEVWVTADAPQNSAEYDRVLGCPIRFDKPENALFFRKEHVEEPVVTSDYNLLQVLVAHAQEKLNILSANAGFYETVKRSVVNLIKPEFPTIDQVAGHLNMSVRTFQRKLKVENHSFKEIIDELRKEFALSYLQNPALSIGEVAFLLNYADSSAFNRSFKRWTGKSPKGFRLNLIAAA